MPHFLSHRTFSTPVISHWTRRQMRSPRWSGDLSALHAQSSYHGALARRVHKDDDPVDAAKRLPPLGKIAKVKDIVAAVLYLVQAAQVTGEVLHVDGGAHAGRW